MGSDGEKKQQFQIMNNYPSDLAKYAAEGNKAKVAELLQAGADITPVDSLEQTALIYCVREVSETEQNALDRAECTRLLINAGADINTPDKYGDTPLCLACMDGGELPKTGVVAALCDAGVPTRPRRAPPPRSRCAPTRARPLTTRATWQADVNQVSENFRMTPLHWAAVCGHADVCEVLVTAGSKKKKIDRQRRIPLDVAKEQLDRIREGLDHFGQEYAGKDKAAQTLKFTRCVEYLESVTVRS